MDLVFKMCPLYSLSNIPESFHVNYVVPRGDLKKSRYNSTQNILGITRIDMFASLLELLTYSLIHEL